MTVEAPYPSLLDFSETWNERDPTAKPSYVITGSGIPTIPDLGLRERSEEIIDTVVAVQRADWLQEGVYVGPRSLPEVYRDVLQAARVLRVAVPPAIVSGVSMRRQSVYGTDSRAFLHLSSFFFPRATPGERLFVTGRLCGHIATTQVTWTSLYALVTDENGIRRIGRKHLGPTLEVVLAPLSLGLRLALSRWHRVAEVTADRAGLLCAKDLDAAGQALLRMALAVRPDVSPDDYLHLNRNQRGGGSPSRWLELLESKPWMYKRMQALALFARSELYVEGGGVPVEEPILTTEDLNRQTLALLRVS